MNKLFTKISRVKEFGSVNPEGHTPLSEVEWETLIKAVPPEHERTRYRKVRLPFLNKEIIEIWLVRKKLDFLMITIPEHTEIFSERILDFPYFPRLLDRRIALEDIKKATMPLPLPVLKSLPLKTHIVGYEQPLIVGSTFFREVTRLPRTLLEISSQARARRN